MAIVTEHSAHPHSPAMHQHPYPHSHPQTHSNSPQNLQLHPHTHPHPSLQRSEHERDVHGLRLYLGSILSPKRYTPTSRPVSGTASPCPAHFGPGLSHSYHPVQGPSNLHTPVEMHDTDPFVPPNSTVPRVQTPPTHSAQVSFSPSPSPSPRQVLTPPHEEHADGHMPVIMVSSNSNVYEQLPHPTDQARVAAESAAAVARKKEKEKEARTEAQRQQQQHAHGLNAYIATLQSKHAWDALVHGNMQ